MVFILLIMPFPSNSETVPFKSIPGNVLDHETAKSSRNPEQNQAISKLELVQKDTVLAKCQFGVLEAGANELATTILLSHTSYRLLGVRARIKKSFKTCRNTDPIRKK
jgi:hypothetical protein